MSNRLYRELLKIRRGGQAMPLANDDDQSPDNDDGEVVTAMPTALMMDDDEEFNENLRKFAQSEFVVETENWWGNRPIWSHTSKSKNDFKDNQLTNLKIVSLKHLSYKEIGEVGDYVFGSIHGKLTKTAIAGLMLLSYNLVDDSGNYLMAEYDPFLVDVANSIHWSDVEETRLCTSQNKEMLMEFTDLDDDELYTEGHKRIAIGYTYLAASYLRLFSKSVENFMKIDGHLRTKFSGFYGFDFPFNEFHPEKDAVIAIKKQFDLDSRLRNTLYVILYCGNLETEGSPLKEFLYRIQLSYTGLHSYVLYLKALEQLGMNCAELGNVMQIPMFHNCLDSVSKLLEIEKNPDTNHELHMWKFGRIFDKNFMSTLQIKSCVSFGLVLAYIVVETTPGRKNGPLNIIGLKEASPETKGEAMYIAAKVVYICRRRVLGANFADAAIGRVLQKKKRTRQ